MVFSTDRGTRFRSEGPSRGVDRMGMFGTPYRRLGDVGSGDEPSSDEAEDEDWLVNGEGSR